MRITRFAIFAPRGKPIASSAVGADINELKPRELALLESGERFPTPVELTSDVLWGTDADERFVQISEQSCKPFSPRELAGRVRSVWIDGKISPR